MTFFDMNLYYWHLVVLYASGYVLWQLVGLYRPVSRTLQALRVNYVNFGMALSGTVLVFASFLHMFYANNQSAPKSLLLLCLIIWSCTICGIAVLSPLPRPIVWMACLLVSAAPLVHYLFDIGDHHGISGFLNKLDQFTHITGGEQGKGVKISDTLKWLFFFTHSFVVLNYYGQVFLVIYSEKVSRGERVEGLEEGAIKRSIVVGSFALAFFIGLILTGIDIASLSLFSGLLAAGVSIALRDLVANMAAGMLLLWDKSIKTKDVIALDEKRYGEVKGMTMRYLILEDRNDVRFLVPNSDLINKTITNWTQKTRTIRLKLDFGVAYNTDLSKVKDIMRSVCLGNSRVLQDPAPRPLITEFADSSIRLQLRFFIGDPENGIRNVMGELYEGLHERFLKEGVKVPFPQREIRLLNSTPPSYSGMRKRNRATSDRPA